MHIMNNPQLNLYHHTVREQKRLLTEEHLHRYHNELHRREKEVMEDYNRRVERMNEVSTVPTTLKQIRKSIDILC